MKHISKRSRDKKMNKLMKKIVEKEKRMEQSKKETAKYAGNGIHTWMGDVKGGHLDRGKIFYSK
jgi:hypothetical protein|tara:strand:+ start:160 stop:351 length:192 start_codon:yes stop_codon:yes gene_type:complete